MGLVQYLSVQYLSCNQSRAHPNLRVSCVDIMSGVSIPALEAFFSEVTVGGFLAESSVFGASLGDAEIPSCESPG